MKMNNLFNLFSYAEYREARCTHSEYFSQFVNRSVFRSLLHTIPMIHIIRSSDKHFNDIPLQIWNRLSDYYFSSGSLAEKVCVFKEAAKFIRETYNGTADQSYLRLYK